jgi:tetratricopeptide (TPR) repeat protein
MFCACLIAFAPSCSSIRTLKEPPGNEKKTVDDTGKRDQKTVDDTGKQAQKPIDDTGKQAQKPIDDTGKQAQKPIDDTGKQAQKPIDDTGKQAQKPIDNTGKQSQKGIDDTVIQAQVDIAGGEYKKSLELYSSAYEKKHTLDMRDNYSATGEQIRKTADTAYQRKDFAEAGSIYNTLIESGIVTRDFADSLSFNEDYLNGQKNACSKALLEAGLTTYRDGKLDDAISIWKKALVFDRDNKDIKSAIETARTQLQNLKNIK